MEYQTIKENGKIKFVVLPVEEFNRLLEKIDDDREAIRLSSSEPLYDQQEAEEYIFMNPVKRERLEKGWTQTELAKKMKVKQSTIAKWERQGAVYRKTTRKKFAEIFGANESSFM
jgi:ribosome-binding protein aMBF1 (putative translation factor)